MYGWGTTTLVINNEELNDIMKIVQALEDQNILLKGVTKTIKNDINNQKGGAIGHICLDLDIYRTGQGIRKKNINSAKTTSFNKY